MRKSDRDALNFLIFGFFTVVLFVISFFNLGPLQNDDSYEKRECDFTKQNDNFALFYTSGCSKVIETSNPKKGDCWIKIEKNICDMVFEQPVKNHILIEIPLYIGGLVTAYFFAEMGHPSY